MGGTGCGDMDGIFTKTFVTVNEIFRKTIARTRLRFREVSLASIWLLNLRWASGLHEYGLFPIAQIEELIAV